MSPYQPFALTERTKLKKVTDHSLGFSLFITDLQGEGSLLSSLFPNSNKIFGWPFMASEKLQNVLISVFTTSSNSSEPEQRFTASSNSTSKANQLNRLNFSTKNLNSDCPLTTKKVKYCGPEAKNEIISVKKIIPTS